MIESVEFATCDGLTLRGELRRGDGRWIVLVHSSGEDLDGWRPLAGSLARSGWTVLAFDLRGHGGSDGDADPAAIGADLLAAVTVARSEGAALLYVGAAGSSCGPALEAAVELGAKAIVAIAPTKVSGSGLRVPRFIAVSSRDREQQAAAKCLYRGSGWAVTVNVPTDAKGLGLLECPLGRTVGEAAARFLEDRRADAIGAEHRRAENEHTLRGGTAVPRGVPGRAPG